MVICPSILVVIIFAISVKTIAIRYFFKIAQPYTFPNILNKNANRIYITWVTRGSSSLSTARVRISRLFGSHLKLMLAVLMLVMVSGILAVKKNEQSQGEEF